MDTKTCTTLAFLFLFLFAPLFSLDYGSAEEINKKENYTYEAVPAGRKQKASIELIEMEFFHSQNHISYTSKKSSSDNQEIIKLEMSSDGTFLSGTKNVVDNQSVNIDSAQILIKNRNIYVERYKQGKKKIKEFTLPQFKPLAVDASLLILMRSFPFDEAIKWKVFMVDFSQHSVTVTVENSGVETISVQAGTFECYRMEVKVNFFIIHPKITYWISKSKPHFLVKHRGKRGPFTPSYITSLISME